VSRVPETSATAREELVSALQRQPEWQTSADGELRWRCRQLELPQEKERWLIVSSQASQQRVHASMQRQVEREQQRWEKRLWQRPRPALCLPS
jgi:hypothetical protein